MYIAEGFYDFKEIIFAESLYGREKRAVIFCCHNLKYASQIK
jgi:hypothetical protein